MNIIVMGMPGAGKGTQADRIATSYQIPHISTGGILRSFAQNKSPIGLEAKTFMEKGELVPDNLMKKLLWDRLGEEDTKKGFILDGYPRTVQQAEALEAYLHSRGVQLDAVLYLAVGKGVVRRRLTKQFQSPILFPNAIQEWGGSLPRMDDQSEIVERRIQVSEAEIEELLHFYQKRGLVSIVDGDQESSKVFRDIQPFLRLVSRIPI